MKASTSVGIKNIIIPAINFLPIIIHAFIVSSWFPLLITLNSDIVLVIIIINGTNIFNIVIRYPSICQALTVFWQVLTSKSIIRSHPIVSISFANKQKKYIIYFL